MSNEAVGSSAPRKRGGWLKKLGFALGILVVLVIVLYFVVTSSGFFKSVILPRVSKSLGAEVTVSDASISPFSEVTLKNLKVQTTGTEPLVTATEVHARYNLRAIMGGNILVDELTMTSPTVTLVEKADGTSNLDPITKAQKPGEKKSEKPATPSKPAQINLRKIALNDATVRQLKTTKDGEKSTIEISHLNLAVDGVKNGQTGKLSMSAGVKEEKTSPKPDVSGVLEAKASGEYTFALSADLAPTSVKGSTKLDVSRAEGAMADVAGASLELDCELSPSEIKDLSLHLQKGTQHLGELRVSGPFSAEKKEGKLTVIILSIDRQLLNLVGAKSGFKFGTTTINSTNQIELAKGGTLITTVGQMEVSKFQMKRGKDVTPTLDFRSDYNVVVDTAQSNSVLRALSLTGMQGGSQLLHGELTSPMRISWGNAAGEVGDSTFTFALTGLNLPDWKPFLGDDISSGKLSAQAKILSQQAGKQLTFDVGVQVEDLSARFGSNAISQAGINLQLNGQATDMKQHTFKNYSLQVMHRKNPVLSVTGSGTYDKGEKDGDNADMQVAVQLFLPRVMELSPQPDSSLSSGTLELKGHLVQKGTAQSITGNLALSDLTGNFGSNQFKSFGATAELDVAKTPEQVDIKKAAGKVTESGKAGGSFDVAGKYDLTKKTAQFTARLSEFNENGLRFALEPMLGDKKLVTVALNANTTIQYDPQAASSFKGDLQVTKLVVNDPKGEIPNTPLETKMQFDVSTKKQVTDIRQFQIALTPTARAKNEVQLTGQVDATLSNAITGNLKLAADSLDLTTYYDLFGGDKKGGAPRTASASGTASSGPASSGAEKEPAAHPLPFRNFTADATIKKLYLREVEVADAQAAVKIDGGHIVVNPFKLALNGAPVNANVDLNTAVEGYVYDISFGADGIPLSPFVNSFQPERKGQIGGTLTASAGFKGQGITGASLQKYLTGKFDVSSTNLNLSIPQLQDKRLKALVTVVSSLPEILHDPAGGGLALVGSFLGVGKGGLAGELSKSPIETISANGQIGAGKVTLGQAQVRSRVFIADATGDITLLPVLTNSPLRIPVSLSVSRPIASQLGMVPANTPTNAAYVKLADFYTMKGTVGDPKNSIDAAAVLKMALQAFGGAGSGTAGTVKGVLNSVLGGQTSTNNAGTNQPADKIGGLIQGLGGLLGGGSNTATNGATNQQAAPINNLLNDLFAPKKKQE